MNTDNKEQAAYTKALGVLAQSHGRTYKSHQSIFKEGEAGKEVFFIVSGAVDVYIGHGNSRRDLWTLVDGDIFGEMALLDQLVRSASVEARKDTTVVALERADFVRLVSKYPVLAMKVIELMGHRMRKLDTQFKIESGYIKGQQMGQTLTPTGEGPLSGVLTPLNRNNEDE